MFLPDLRGRRQVAGAFSRGVLPRGRNPVPGRGNRALAARPLRGRRQSRAATSTGSSPAAALPPDFAFVIKKEMVRVPLASLLLRRLGSAFVERFDRHKGASDARRVWKLAATGQSLVFFPEGTFDATARSADFSAARSATAERSQMHIVAVAIHGTRAVLPSGSILIRRNAHPLRDPGVLDPEGARQRSRELIAQAVGEPLAP